MNRKKKRGIRIGRVFLLLLILAAIIGGVCFLVSKKDDIGSKKSDSSEQEPEKEKVEDITFNMTVTGDVLCHNTQYFDAYIPSEDTYDFSYMFDDVKKYFDAGDICVGTMETNFAGKDIGYSNYPLFNSPDELARDLKELGYDVMATATNHCLDKGIKGMFRTIEVLHNNGIENYGTYLTKEDSEKILIKDVKGVKIAFLTYDYGTNGIPIPDGYEYAISMIDKNKMQADIKKAREEGAELISVNMHWGEEYREQPTAEQKELADFLFKNGVDLVLGSHTHCLEPMERRTVELEDGTTKDGFIVYSLGNFMSGQNHENSRQSVILNIQITKHGDDGKFTIDSIKYTPIYMYNIYNGKALNAFKVMDIREELSKYESGDTSIGSSLYNTLQSELEHVEKVMGPEL
ncbi:MAG: CapA family protein [Clostridia bacterium]|nr:CapA family protein [Clostridia bacterium]